MDVAAGALRHALTYLPAGEYRRFCEWLLDDPVSRPRWLQVLGVTSLVRMTSALLDGVVTAAERAVLVEKHGPPLFAYLTWEAASDNLAIGLARRTPSDGTHHARRELVRSFNDLMITRITGSRAVPDGSNLSDFSDLPNISDISLFHQSLSEAGHRALLTSYVAAAPDASPDAVEYAARDVLLANIAAAVALVVAMRPRVAGPDFRDGLLRRYQAVNSLLSGAFDDPLRTGSDTILVAPTLIYYTSALAEEVRPLRSFAAVVGDGSLHRACDTAALLVRALNDCGPGLLEQSPERRAALLAALRSFSGDTLDDALAAVGPAAGTRLAKDVRFGEYNICLDGIRDKPPGVAIDAFGDRLAQTVAAYRSARIGLRRSCEVLTSRLGDFAVAEIIRRFVAFHRRMYASAFSDQAGDYAIG